MLPVSNYSNKKVLILDDMPEMRTSLKGQANVLGFEKITLCPSIEIAMRTLRAGFFDIILSDYHLGEDTNGQQFLEYLRKNKVISRRTLFIMVTGEKSYENVVAAAECLPDDYLLRPFSTESLRLRIERLLEKKARLSEIDNLQDWERWDDVVRACEQLIDDHDPYMTDAMRIKGYALLQAHRYEDAARFYQQVVETRPMPWARLGLAHAQKELGAAESAKTILAALIQASPQLLAAYDLLGHIHAEQGDPQEALRILEDATRISPASLSRHRAIAAVAEDSGDHGRMEEALSLVIRKTQNTPLRDSDDYVRLGNIYAATGKPDRALKLVEQAHGLFKSEKENPALAAVEAMAHHQKGEADKARQALQRAIGGNLGKLPSHAALTVARACLLTGQQEAGEEILKQVVQSNLEAKAVHEHVSQVMASAGSADKAEQLIHDSVEEIIRLNNAAVRCGQEGKLAEAAAMLTAAATRLPGNVQIVANATYAVLVDIIANGMDLKKMQDARRFYQGVLELNPGYRKLDDIRPLWQEVAQKYGIRVPT